MSPLEIWYDRIDLARAIEDAPDKAARKRRERLQEQARKRVAENLFPKLVTTDGGRMRIVDQPPLIFHPPELTPDIALGVPRRLPRLAGRRSTGAVRPVSLRGRRGQDRRGGQRRHPLLRGAVHVRGRSSAAAAGEGGQQLGDGAVPRIARARKIHNGKRVVVGQHLMQPASDIFLGWANGPTGRDFYVRQLRDMKVSITLIADPRPVHELRQVLRPRARPRPRQHRLRGRDRRLPRHQQQGRQGVRTVRRGLRRPDRTRPPRPRRGNRQRPHPRHHGNA